MLRISVEHSSLCGQKDSVYSEDLVLLKRLLIILTLYLIYTEVYVSYGGRY